MDQRSSAFLKPGAGEGFFNRVFGVLVGWGLGLSHNYLLQVEGRTTGRLYSTPVNVLDYNGKRYVVAPRGETQWVRNARASRRIWLKKGRTRQSFGVRSLADPDKPAILKEYLDRYKRTVQRYFTVPAGSSLEPFRQVASQYPVFELISDRFRLV